MNNFFDLDVFLANYRPNKPRVELYLRTDALIGYKHISDVSEFTKLISGAHNIKYVNNCNLFLNNKISKSHVEEGGNFVSGGKYIDGGKYIAVPDHSTWTHLLLRSEVSQTRKDEKGEPLKCKAYKYTIKISTHDIFYKEIITLQNINNFITKKKF